MSEKQTAKQDIATALEHRPRITHWAGRARKPES